MFKYNLNSCKGNIPNFMQPIGYSKYQKAENAKIQRFLKNSIDFSKLKMNINNNSVNMHTKSNLFFNNGFTLLSKSDLHNNHNILLDRKISKSLGNTPSRAYMADLKKHNIYNY